GRVGVDDAGAEFLGEIAAACVEDGVGGRLDAGLDLAVGAVGGGDEECGCGRDVRCRRMSSLVPAWLCRRQLAGGEPLFAAATGTDVARNSGEARRGQQIAAQRACG